MAHQQDIPIGIGGLPDIVFSSQFPDVLIENVGESAVVTITIGDEQVLKETLYPGSTGIVLEDLQSLVEPYARQQLTVMVGIAASCQSGRSYEAQVRVLYAKADLGDEISAQEFYDRHFLSTLMGPKHTALGRLEVLNYFGTGSASVTAIYDDGSEQVFPAVATGGNNEYTRIDVSPDQYKREGVQLLEYHVTAGAREQDFVVEPEKPDCAPIMLFVNSFGVEELLYCFGLHEVSPEYKRSQTRLGRFKRTYKLEEIRHFKADTGPLTTAMADWADELLRSDEIRVCNFYQGQVRPGKEVVITDSKSDRSNADEELPRMTFTYEYSQRNHNVLQLFREGRIFDNTFDDTFN